MQPFLYAIRVQIGRISFCRKYQALYRDIFIDRKREEERIIEKCDFLDTIMNHMLNEDGGESPKFVRDCEKKVTEEIRSYTDRIRMASAEKPFSGEEAVMFTEENADGLLDSVCDSNRVYMKKGMKLGAKLVFQLLGL